MSRRVTLLIAGAFLFLLQFNIACRLQPVANSSVPTIGSVVQADKTRPADDPGMPFPTPTHLATSAPSATPSLAPPATATELAPLKIAVPNAWRLEAHAAAEAIDATRSWTVVVAEDPAAMLAQGEVQAALVADDEGFAAGTRPLALAVAFQEEWQEVTLAQAEGLQSDGHPLITVVSWDELLPAQRALRIDGLHISDPQYPLQQSWSVHAVAEAEESAAQLAALLHENNAIGDIELAAVGDIMLDRALGNMIASGDTSFPFALIQDVLRAADLTVGNFECALGDTGEAVGKSYTFRAPPAAVWSLAEAGFDLVSLANNHALDYGPLALEQGMGLLQQAGLATVGAGMNAREAHAPYIVDVNGVRLGFLAYVNVPVEGRAPHFDTASWRAGPDTPGVAWAEPDLIASEVRALHESVDEVIVILHSGYEYVPSPGSEQAASARAAVDAGASLVIGHHAHILQGVEFRNNGVIVYGLGNFAFNIIGSPETAVLKAWFDENGLRQIDFGPAIIQGSGQPALASGEQASAIRQRIYALSRALN